MLIHWGVFPSSVGKAWVIATDTAWWHTPVIYVTMYRCWILIHRPVPENANISSLYDSLAKFMHLNPQTKFIQILEKFGKSV